MTDGSVWDIVEGPSDIAAQRLLGCTLSRTLDHGVRLVGRIVETEAYDMHDAASHSYRGRTPRTDVMFGPAGRMYVYFTYGMHYCCNVVTGPEGYGSAVLIRAVELLDGLDILADNRGQSDNEMTPAQIINLTNGPAKLCQAFGIDKSWNGHDLRQPPLQLAFSGRPLADSDIVQTARVGISQAKDIPWRFYIRGNAYVSRT